MGPKDDTQKMTKAEVNARWQAERDAHWQEWQASEAERKAKPVTAGDIDRLIDALNKGWIGRGFAIGIGTAIFGFLAGLILISMMSSAYTG